MFLNRAGEALDGLGRTVPPRSADQETSSTHSRPCWTDARDSLAALELLPAQPAISSQLIGTLNASTQLRALLTDVYLLGERTQQAAANQTQLEETAVFASLLPHGLHVPEARSCARSEERRVGKECRSR